jgi:2',3'-cyclic-nucleotide 2'-phosphodiesterase/3'-nucleotidase
MEQTASYFKVQDNQLNINEAFLYPKVEHYNYDLYDGLDYTIDVSKPQGQRITACVIQGHPLNPEAYYTVVLNNYRANGGGDYLMFQSAELIKNIDTTLFQLAIDAISSKASFTNHLPLTLLW